ncbi:MAG: MFS transporter [Actinomycetales bacterium]
MSERRPPLWPLYIGGFLGPFGAPVVTTMLPEMQQDLGGSITQLSTTLSAYLFPFALCMLFSGTLAERFGRRRTVRAGYLVYTLAAIACALAPTLETFTLARVVQGAANAFTTPVLVAAISDAVPASRLGRSLGLFGSMQATGQAMAPLIGGLAADVDWRLAFWGTALVSAMLATMPPQDSEQTSVAGLERWKALANRQLGLASLTAALAFLTTMAMAVVAALYVRDVFGLSASVSGLIVAVFGLSGLATGRQTGGLLDRFGRVRAGGYLHLILGIFCAVTGIVGTLALPSPIPLILVVVSIAIAGAAATGTRTVVQGLAVTSAPTNRSGATSVMLACQFSGAALAPLLWVPIYESQPVPDGGIALVVAGSTAVIAGLILLLVHRTGWLRTSS